MYTLGLWCGNGITRRVDSDYCERERLVLLCVRASQTAAVVCTTHVVAVAPVNVCVCSHVVCVCVYFSDQNAANDD